MAEPVKDTVNDTVKIGSREYTVDQVHALSFFLPNRPRFTSNPLENMVDVMPELVKKGDFGKFGTFDYSEEGVAYALSIRYSLTEQGIKTLEMVSEYVPEITEGQSQ